MDGMVKRGVTQRFDEIFDDTPVVVVQGPRQCGKSTLVKQLCDLPYVTLDDSLALDSATRSPGSFLKSYPHGVVIDEVQRAPHLSRSIKQAVDENRKPGMYVLTGSANIMLLPKLSDSLAGRMEVLNLWPFSQGEILGREDRGETVSAGDFAAKVFADDFGMKTGGVWYGSEGGSGGEWGVDRVVLGGFPEPVGRSSDKRRAAWFDSYLKALVERDVRALSDIEGLTALPRLLQVLAKSPYDVVNITALSRDTGIAASTLTRYLSLLEGVFLTKAIRAWTSLHKGKAAKTARLAFVDSGLLCWLGGYRGQVPLGVLEGFVAMELVKQSGWSEVDFEVQHFRSVRQYSVPIVLVGRDGKLVGVTVIDREVAEPEDFRALQFLADVASPDFVRGVVLTLGGEGRVYDERLCSVPVSGLWG